MSRRIITTENLEEDVKIESHLRPQLLDDYIGQEKAKEILKKYNQEHILNGYDNLDENKKQVLLNQIFDTDFELIKSLYANTKKQLDNNDDKIEPMDYMDKFKLNEKYKYYENIGKDAIKQGKLAAVTMAGGQGTRLGHNGPKGTYDIGLDSHKSLFELLAEALKEEGIEVVLVNSNPATIMTDKEVADKIYIEPLTIEFIEKIIEKEDLPSTKGCSQQNSYEIIDGILHFKSPEAMSTLVNVLEKMSDEEFFAWEKTNNFYSLYHAISNAEEDIFSDSVSFEKKLKQYENLVYLDENETIQAKVPSRLYQLICNNEGYFFINKYKHQVISDEIITKDNQLRNIESRKYIVNNSPQTRTKQEPRYPIASSTYTGNKRRVHVTVLYIREIVRNTNGEWVGKQILQLESTSYKRVLGRYKRYKTVHSVDVLGFYCSKGVYKKEDGNYSTRNVRFEGLGGGGSVGEKKTMTMNYFLSPSNLWIPEKYISINEKDISFVQTRVSTRGTGNSGAVVVYTRDSFISLPFIIPTTGTPQIIRPLITENFGE